MRASKRYLIPIVAVSLLVSACGSSSKSSSSTSSSVASQPASTPTASSSSAELVKTASNSKIGGTILVDSQGLTLYRLTGESGGKFICTSATCLKNWHPLVATSTSAPSGSVPSLGVVKRPDGTEQVTYKGSPLYTFAADTAPGQANGQGIKDVGTWEAIMTASTHPSAPPASSTSSSSSPQPSAPPTSSTSSSGSGGYGY
jgi:predicted lipoprotein with Yx(FWY)xxD motif